MYIGKYEIKIKCYKGSFDYFISHKDNPIIQNNGNFCSDNFVGVRAMTDDIHNKIMDAGVARTTARKLAVEIVKETRNWQHWLKS